MIKTIRYNGKDAANVYVMRRDGRVEREWAKHRFMEGNARNNLLMWIGNNVERYTGGTFIDCGAHIGNHTIFFAVICQADRVYAFEPSEHSAYAWRRNIELNKLTQCTLYEIALGDKKKKVGLSSDTESTLNHITAGNKYQMMPFDTAMKNAEYPGGVKLVKIDVEGSEVITLRGMKRFLKKHKPDIAIECTHEGKFDDVKKILFPIGYTFVLGKQGKPLQLNSTPTYILRHEEKQ